MLYYFESDSGCGIRSLSKLSQQAARAELLKEVGTFNGLRVFRKATDDDIAWVKAMGGYIPEEQSIC